MRKLIPFIFAFAAMSGLNVHSNTAHSKEVEQGRYYALKDGTVVQYSHLSNLQKNKGLECLKPVSEFCMHAQSIRPSTPIIRPY